MLFFPRTAVLALVVVTGTILLAQPRRAEAQDIDQLFRNFNSQLDGNSYIEAERTARQMLQASTSQSWLAASYNCLGRALNAQERYDEAIAAYRQGLQYPLNSTNVNRGWIPNNLGNVYRNQKKLEEAERYYKQALSEFNTMHGRDSTTVATVRSNLGWVYHDQKKWDQSVNEHYEALRIRRAQFGENSSETGTSYNGLGSAYTDGGRLEAGRVELENALAIKEATDGPNSHDTAVVLNNLAENASKQGQFEKADRYVHRALAIREGLYGKNSKHVVHTLESLAEYQEKAGKTEDAATTRLQASRMKEALAKGGTSKDNPFYVGQKIQVTANTAHVMAAGKPIGAVSKGMEFEVTHINGPWCGVNILVGGEQKSGWLNSSQATLASVAAIANKPIELKHEVVSNAGGFRIKMPKPAVEAKQTVNGVQHNAYTVEIGPATFVAGYFDIPAGLVLTFDAGIRAYVVARKGTVERSGRITLEDEYPGRDVLIKLPGGDYSRMQVYMVGSRQYQLIIEGTKELVTSQQADEYFGSFRRS